MQALRNVLGPRWPSGWLLAASLFAIAVVIALPIQLWLESILATAFGLRGDAADGLLALFGILMMAGVTFIIARGYFRNPSVHLEPHEQARLGELSRALSRPATDSEFELHLQPIVNLQTREAKGFEALVRWHHPTKGLLYPDGFIPLLEKTGRISELTAHVFELAFALHRQLRADGHDLYLSVNISALDLEDEQLVPRLLDALERHRVPRSSIVLEVTESVRIAEGGCALATLFKLKDLGLHLFMDDFGTGFTSLARLYRTPFSAIKIDKSFVMNLDRDDEAQKMLQGILGLARSTELMVVAEGVESMEIASQLTMLGVTAGQGFGFARPMPVHEALIWLRSNRAGPNVRQLPVTRATYVGAPAFSTP